MRPLSVRSMLQDVAMHATSPSSSVNHGVAPQSPWHSPVPYLFGGLAAMLGLIAFALLILACSYWRLSSSSEQDSGRNGEEVDEEKEIRSGDKAANGAYEEKFLVIMAGENMPRFIATPAMKKCTCGANEGKMVVSLEDSVVVGEEKKFGGNEEKVRACAMGNP
ncbi:unnamed protein product [Eruca vesicaria subsp. sativa]|uniref:Uncharacterized protein n=1 Tax=Eruca vesicaria subsp. sativa TaxID=29727 RepID=A0ABC8JI24_ERUVS|nr:unnamed protein product [Eruca vesicaria subsp. sativa]